MTPAANRPVTPGAVPPVAPVAPVTQPPVQPAAVAVPSAPVAAPAPIPAAAPAPPAQTAAVDQTVAIFLHLSSGERVWVGRFDDAQLAEQRATDIVRALNRPEPGVWAKFGNRPIRPDAVVSIEIAPRRED